MLGDSYPSALSAAQAGGEWAFAQLYEAYNPLLERYFPARSWAAAEDLAAETWMGAARGLARFRGEEAQFRAWLFTIAHPRLADYLKERSRRVLTHPEGEAPEVPAPDDTEQSVLDGLSGRAAAARSRLHSRLSRPRSFC